MQNDVVIDEADEAVPLPQAQAGADVVDEGGDGAAVLPEEATANVDGSVTLRLKYPRTIGIKRQGTGEVVSEVFEKLTFHRLTGADLAAISAAAPAAVTRVAFQRSLHGVKAPVVNALVDRMDAYDVENGGRVIESFLPSGRAGRKTGR